MRNTVFSFLLVLACVPFSSANAADPVVSNVTMEQLRDGSGLVLIQYDVADADGDSLAIALQLSDDGGASFLFPVLNTSGDLGNGILPGEGKTIVWDAGSIPEPIAIASLQAKIVASDVGVLHNSHSPRLVAITDGSSIRWSDPDVIEKFSRADLCILMGHNLWKGGAYGTLNVLEQMRALNPDIVLIGYVSVKSAIIAGPQLDPDSYWYKWYERTEPYFVQTTEGDIAQDWPISRLINILEPGCRAAMLETINEMQDISLNVFDGIMWDYFNNYLWVSPEVDVEGDPDMDGDGIGHWDDWDERVAYQEAQVELVTAARDTLGDDFIQIFNGQRAYGDASFAGLADGAFYELFPTLFYPDPDMGNALDPEYGNNIFDAYSWFRADNGGPYMVLSNVWYNGFFDSEGVHTQIITGDKFRAISLLAGTYASWNSNPDGDHEPLYNWSSHEVSLGEPLGPPTFDGPFIRRDYQYGNVEIEMKSGNYPNPFDYRIWCLGQLVSELAIPHHTP